MNVWYNGVCGGSCIWLPGHVVDIGGDVWFSHLAEEEVDGFLLGMYAPEFQH